MTDAERLAGLLGSVPRTCDRAIVIYPDGEAQSACAWFGMTAEQVAMLLYQVADMVIEQRIPLKATPHGPK